MTRNEMMDHAIGKINITDFDPDTLLWVYDDLDEITTKLLVQLALDNLAQIKVEQMNDQESGEETSDQGQDGD